MVPTVIPITCSIFSTFERALPENPVKIESLLVAEGLSRYFAFELHIIENLLLESLLRAGIELAFAHWTSQVPA